MHNPGNYTIRIEPGCTWAKTLTVKNSNGTPFNLTGYTPTMVVTNDDVPVPGVTPTVTVTSAINGQMTISFDLTDTAILELLEDARYLLKVSTVGNAIVLPLLKGRLTSNKWKNG